MARLTKDELEKVKKNFNVSRLYSWSRINCFMTSPYEYFLKYVLHKKEDVDNCAYAPMGGICHEIIEKYYGNEIPYEDMVAEFDDGWLTSIEIADLKFDRNDEVKNNNIRGKYHDNLVHFFRNHVPIDGGIAIEKFVATKIGSNVLQGYIDAVHKDADGNFHVIDWKTSTKYSGKTAEEKCGQLVVYALGLHQAGVPLDKIKICWNFLKYCTVQYKQKNGAVKTRDVERCQLGDKMQSNVKMWLKEFGYEDKVDEYLMDMIDTNSLDVLPDDVREMYKINDCYVYVDLTDKLIEKWENEITAAIRDIAAREKDYAETKNDKCFFDDEEDVKKQSYYFSTLMGYSANLHLPYKQYLERLEAQKNGEDMFGGVGDSVADTDKVICNKEDVDLSWLNDLA